MSSERVLKIVEPVFVTLESPDGNHSKRYDVYAIRRILQEAEKKPNDEQRWNHVLEWLAKEWEVERSSLAENMAIHLNNAVMELVQSVNKELAKNVFTSASSPASTPDSPPEPKNGS